MKGFARATIASVITKEMERPRFAESARKEEEEANHRVAKHESFSSSNSLQVGERMSVEARVVRVSKLPVSRHPTRRGARPGSL